MKTKKPTKKPQAQKYPSLRAKIYCRTLFYPDPIDVDRHKP